MSWGSYGGRHGLLEVMTPIEVRPLPELFEKDIFATDAAAGIDRVSGMQQAIASGCRQARHPVDR